VPTITPIPASPTATPIPCDRGQFVKDVSIPDDTEIAAGAAFQKTWRIKNNGSCTWTSNYALIFYSGDAMSGQPSAPITNGTVPPGSTIDITVTLTAPTTPGTYKGNWRLRNGGGVIFGIGENADQSFWVQIKSITPTPTPTVTPAVNVAFDFIAQGPNAHWRNSTTNLPWGDQDSDAAGIAAPVTNLKMEDGNTYPNLLATYPQQITDGMILGLYPQYKIQTNDHLRTRIGFRYSCGTANARFQIRYVEGQSAVTVLDQLESCDGSMANIDVNLANLVGHTVQFELVVLANGSAAGDVTLWVAPRIER
jgi:Ig-like domain from next to BRCA1 gene